MRQLLRAEWIKIAGNLWVSGFLIWIFPVGALGFIVLMLLGILLFPSMRQSFSQDAAPWTEEMIRIWGIPNNILGRMLLLGFTAVVFAGEYQWATWKNVVPRNRRSAVILAKFLMVGLLVVAVFTAMSLIWGLGVRLAAALAGAGFGPGLTSGEFGAFLRDYGLQAGLAFTAVIIGAGYVALAAMLTRSILGGVMVGLGVTVAEPVSLLGLLILSRLLDLPDIVSAFRLTPFYNLDNVNSWILSGAPSRFISAFEQVQDQIAVADPLSFSVVVLAAWVLGLVSLNVVLFRRQDIIS